MKVGIITFHTAINYGAILQTYATFELVKSMGHEVEVIDYCNKAFNQVHNKYKFHVNKLPLNFKYAVAYILSTFYFWLRRNKNKLFFKYYLKVSNIRSIIDNFQMDQYDVILIGSDQLWNKGITGGVDRIYWGNFESTAKKVAWSVSINNYSFTLEETNLIRNYLKGFSKISVRETESQLFLRPLTNKRVFLTLDPTLCLPSHKWDNLCYSVEEKNFLLAYAVRDYDETLRCAKIIAEERKLKLIVIKAYCGSSLNRNIKESFGPIDFLSYIHAADYVVTSAFHGTIFSILFEKEFTCVIPEGKDNIRTRGLLRSLELEGRIGNSKKQSSSATINYEIVRKRLSVLKDRTLLFLSESFSSSDDS